MNWIEVNGTSLRHELSGGGKTTLVLVHEMGGTLDSWDQVLPALNNTRQVLRYDTRGHGRSDAPKGPYTLDQLVSDVIGLLDTLGIQRAHTLAEYGDVIQPIPETSANPEALFQGAKPCQKPTRTQSSPSINRHSWKATPKTRFSFMPAPATASTIR